MTGNFTRRVLSPVALLLMLPGSALAHGSGPLGAIAHLHPHGAEMLLGIAAIGLGVTVLLRRRRC